MVGTIRCHHFVRNVLLGREVIAVVTENAVYLYLAGTVTPLHVLATGYNPQGLCALSSDANTPWTVACPAITPGAVRIQTSGRASMQLPPAQLCTVHSTTSYRAMRNSCCMFLSCVIRYRRPSCWNSTTKSRRNCLSSP